MDVVQFGLTIGSWTLCDLVKKNKQRTKHNYVHTGELISTNIDGILFFPIVHKLKN